MSTIAWTSFVVVGLILGGPMPSRAGEPSVPPTAVPVNYKFTLAQDDSEIGKLRDATARLAVVTTPARTCRYGNSSTNFPCTLVAGRKVYAGRYPLPSGSAFTTSYSPTDTVEWAKVAQVERGSAEFKKLFDFADGRTPFDCATGSCKLVVHTRRRVEIAGATDAGADVLSICSVVQVGTTIGPPEDCADVGFSRAGETFMKAVVSQTYSVVPTPLPTTIPTPLPTAIPRRIQSPADLLSGGKHVGLIVKGRTLSHMEVLQTTCNFLAAKAIICTNRPDDETFATAGVDSRFFTTPFEWFETFNLIHSYSDEDYGGTPSYTSSFTVTDLLVSVRAGDGFGPAPPDLAALYRKNIAILEKQALFSLCRHHNILLGSDDDERPTVFECYR